MWSPFARFLEQESIIAQYTMASTPQQNGVAEERIKHLRIWWELWLEIEAYPLFLYNEVIMIVMFVLNHVPSKVVPITPFEI